MLSKRVQAFVPLFFWFLLIAIKLIRIIPMYEGEDLIFGLNTILYTTPLDVITFSLFYYILIPNIIYKKQLTLTIGSTLLYWILYGLVWSWFYKAVGRTVNFEESVIIYKASLGHTLLYSLYAVVLRLSVDWFNKFQHQRELEKQNSITELALLRSQINPHFLFNTLNNIHSFSSHDSEKTSFAIIKLSEIMRYMLYEANGEKVLLEKEIDYINNYIALQKLRFKERDFVKFTVDGKTLNMQIPPMIFLPFIENAFKHGTSSISNAIEIYIRIHNKEIYFRCTNQIKALTETEKNQPGGLGIKNIKRRLDLLFPSSHILNIKKSNNVYFVELIIYPNAN